MKNCDYYIGLDIGTDSVGWAVTDTEYNILKTNRKAMWGSHLFESGKTAEERRMHRTARRRTDRAKERVSLLNELFAEEIAKVDPDFFLRLEESKYWEEDKKVVGRFTLFNDDKYTDAEYHAEYPTIYHLRSDLIHNPDKQFDIRLIYLAVSHIIKKRGHFLFEGQQLSAALSFNDVFEELKRTLEDRDIEVTISDASQVEALLKDKSVTVNDKKRKLKALFAAETEGAKGVVDLLAGGTVDLAKMFNDETIKETNNPKISFKSGYDDKVAELEADLGDNFYLIEKIKAVYDWAVLVDILKDEQYLSDAKIADYDKHKKDLALTKALVRKYAPKSYKKIFSENANKKLANYVAYSGHVGGGNKSNYAESYSCSQEDFCKFVLKELGKIEPETGDERYILGELKNFTAMPKQVTKENSVVPYQINLQELRVILENASKYYPFLTEERDGLTVSAKIEKILTFRIPYYVGPLNPNSEHAWIVRKEGKIYPWNFNEKVDKTASATKFIERMTNQCTYLVGETVLPKDSILYSKYSIYNQLNNIRVDGEYLTVEMKNQLFKDKYLDVAKAQKMTKKAILKYLIQNGYCNADSEITGIDNEVTGTMKAYVQFKRILGEVTDADMVDDIVYKITVLGESRDLLKEFLERDYGTVLAESQIKEILRLKYTGWGRLSKTFLTEIYNVDPATGECTSIMSGLENTQNNLMQLLSKNYTYADQIENFNAEKNDISGNITYKDIENLYVSPAVKRSIWRTVLIVKEIVKIAGHNPKKIFVEMARDAEGNQKGQRTVSRKQQLLNLYRNAKDDCAELAKELDKYDENELRSDKLFLYYSQLGRCMYSGEPINLDNLLSSNSIYDIDHIYPQSKTKDDSLDNRVLVKKVLNEEKSDNYPIPASFKNGKTIALWKNLKSCGLISQEKFNRLMRTIGFDANELSGFISRQIVETRQSTKAVADLLNRAYDDTKVVYVKAGNVSRFRQQYDIVKCRSINDYHHAKDAYLNIVVGNVYDTKFGPDVARFISDGNKYSLNRMYDFNVKRGNKVAWVADDDKSISVVKKNVMRNNVLFTRYATEQKGGFFDQMPVQHGGGQMPFKTSEERLSDFSKYGGYNKVAGAYFALVEHEVKGKRVKSFESVPIFVSSQCVDSQSALLSYFSGYLVKVKILIPKVKYNSLFEQNGFRMHLSARANGGKILQFKCGEQLVLNDDLYAYFKKIDKFIERYKSNKTEHVSPLMKISEEENLKVYDAFLCKLKNTKYRTKLSSQIPTLEKGREKFIKLSLEDQCNALYNINVLFKCVPGNTDLKLIGGSGQAGTITMNSNISKETSLYLINQSITGIFENKIDLAAL